MVYVFIIKEIDVNRIIIYYLDNLCLNSLSRDSELSKDFLRHLFYKLNNFV